MLDDVELKRLMAVKSRTYHKQKGLRRSRAEVLAICVRASKGLDLALENKEAARKYQTFTWEVHRDVFDSNSPEINFNINPLRDRAKADMKKAFGAATAEYRRGNHTVAKYYSKKGAKHKADYEMYSLERKRLIDEIHLAKANLDEAKAASKLADSQLRGARAAYLKVKSEHDNLDDLCRAAQSEHSQALEAVKVYIAKIISDEYLSNDSVFILGSRPRAQVWQASDIKVLEPDKAGEVNIYFGGEGKPDGPNHGHYTLDKTGRLKYKRQPGMPRGGHNFIKPVYPKVARPVSLRST